MSSIQERVIARKRQALEQRLEHLFQDLQAVTQQMGQTLSGVETNRLERQKANVEQQLDETAAELEALEHEGRQTAIEPGPILVNTPETGNHRETSMTDTIKVFVSYSHQDTEYLGDDSLLGFLKGLERKDNIEFWTDQKILAGDPWDAVIKKNLRDSRIALVLVSEWFLDSAYCQDVEIKELLAGKAHLLPVILSPCRWQDYQWLSSRQFLPGGDETIEEHYTEAGQRKRLYLKVKEQLRTLVQRVRQVHQTLEPPPEAAGTGVPAGGAALQPYKSLYSGKVRVLLCSRLGDDWRMLADYLEIPPHAQDRFGRGDECRDILVWLENRRRLEVLPEALTSVGRDDLADLLAGNSQTR